MDSKKRTFFWDIKTDKYWWPAFFSPIFLYYSKNAVLYKSNGSVFRHFAETWNFGKQLGKAITAKAAFVPDSIKAAKRGKRLAKLLKLPAAFLLTDAWTKEKGAAPANLDTCKPLSFQPDILNIIRNLNKIWSPKFYVKKWCCFPVF